MTEDVSWAVYELGKEFVVAMNALQLKARDYADMCQMMACLCKDPTVVEFKAFFDRLGAFCEAHPSEARVQFYLSVGKG